MAETLVDPWLLEILRCPVDKTRVREELESSLLLCEQGHEFPVQDGIPNMLPPED